MPYCPQCGSEVGAGEAFCASCGADIAHVVDDAGDADVEEPAGDAAEADDTAGQEQPEAAEEAPAAVETGGDADETAAEADETAADADDTATDVETEPADDDRRIDIPEDLFEADVFEFTFKYPIAESWKPVLIGMALTLGSFLLFPLVLLLGYSFRVGRAAALGQPRAPAYGNWWGLFVDGIRVIAAFIVFLVPVGLVFGVLTVAGLESLAVVWYFAMSLVASAVFPVFYGSGSVKATFANFRFLRFAATVDYWIGYAYLIGVLMALYIGVFVLMFLLMISLIGILLIPPLMLAFYPVLAYLQAALWGRVYHDAAEKGVVDPPSRPDELSSAW